MWPRAEGLRAFSFGDSGPKIHRFRDVPWEFADAEGEGFRSIEHWRDGHQSYYAKRADSRGRHNGVRVRLVPRARDANAALMRTELPGPSLENHEDNKPR